MHPSDPPIRLGRRAILQNGVLLLSAATALNAAMATEKPSAPLRVGLITDLHYADKPAKGSRYYRETLGKLAEAAERFGKARISMLVELGDLIDAAESVETEQRYLKTVNEAFAKICPDRHYVLGNHCVDTLTKQEFLEGVGKQKSYYSFDRGGMHFIVLDSCFRSDGKPYERKNFTWTDPNLPAEELAWLEADLKANRSPCVVFAHQRLDVSNHYGVKNNAEARKILEAAGNVLAVFQGHSHKNELTEIGGIHYCTLVAMVEGSGAENNGYSVLEIQPSGDLRLEGFRKQESHRWERAE